MPKKFSFELEHLENIIETYFTSVALYTSGSSHIKFIILSNVRLSVSSFTQCFLLCNSGQSLVSTVDYRICVALDDDTIS